MSLRIEKLKIMRGVPDANLYSPHFQPWRGLDPFRGAYDEIQARSLVGPEAAWTLYSLARQALAVEGDFVEAGVYRGGTARMLRRLLDTTRGKRLHLFDTFAGMPKTDRQRDFHKEDDFDDTSVDAVSSFVGRDEWIEYHPGFIPDTFRGQEGLRFAFAHIDVDIYQSIIDCCEFIYPRVNSGGIILFDDYGVASCPGARAAVDAFFGDKPEVPLVLRTGQAVVFRHRP
jgi:O-methyltransferase